MGKASNQYWATFDAMLSGGQLERIGISEDRDTTLCLTRLCAALSQEELHAADLADALAGLLLSGQHLGPCDNDADKASPCTRHVEAFNTRKVAAEQALARYRSA